MNALLQTLAEGNTLPREGWRGEDMNGPFFHKHLRDESCWSADLYEAGSKLDNVIPSPSKFDQWRNALEGVFQGAVEDDTVWCEEKEDCAGAWSPLAPATNPKDLPNLLELCGKRVLRPQRGGKTPNHYRNRGIIAMDMKTLDEEFVVQWSAWLADYTSWIHAAQVDGRFLDVVWWTRGGQMKHGVVLHIRKEWMTILTVLADIQVVTVRAFDTMVVTQGRIGSISEDALNKITSLLGNIKALKSGQYLRTCVAHLRNGATLMTDPKLTEDSLGVGRQCLFEMSLPPFSMIRENAYALTVWRCTRARIPNEWKTTFADWENELARGECIKDGKHVVKYRMTMNEEDCRHMLFCPSHPPLKIATDADADVDADADTDKGTDKGGSMEARVGASESAGASAGASTGAGTDN